MDIGNVEFTAGAHRTPGGVEVDAGHLVSRYAVRRKKGKENERRRERGSRTEVYKKKKKATRGSFAPVETREDFETEPLR